MWSCCRLMQSGNFSLGQVTPLVLQLNVGRNEATESTFQLLVGLLTIKAEVSTFRSWHAGSASQRRGGSRDTAKFVEGVCFCQKWGGRIWGGLSLDHAEFGLKKSSNVPKLFTLSSFFCLTHYSCMWIINHSWQCLRYFSNNQHRHSFRRNGFTYHADLRAGMPLLPERRQSPTHMPIITHSKGVLK